MSHKLLIGVLIGWIIGSFFGVMNLLALFGGHKPKAA